MARAKTADAPFAVPDWPAAQKPEMVKVGKITPHPKNPRVHPDGQLTDLGASFDEFGVVWPIVVDENYRLMAGEGRWLTAKKKGYEEYPCIVIRGWSESKKLRFMVADNRLPQLAGFDDEVYRSVLTLIKMEGLPLNSLGLDDATLSELLAEPLVPGMSLSERFGIVPFSVFNAREGWWQDRKQAWLAIGIQSEVGRGENLLKFSDSVALDVDKYKSRQKAKAKKSQTEDLRGGLTHRTTTDPYRAKKKNTASAKAP